MNMEGGYSIDDYNKLMDEQMESQIKPFVNRFISTLEEYRTNYSKSKSSKNYKRANYVRQMLNKLKDDDTGKLMGDLLLNKTKYEMGDEAYNALSDEEKKNHADILTILMQANGKATLTIETLITKATDTGKDSWVDRFRDTTLDDLIDKMQNEDESLKTKADIMAALDRRYNDTAKELLSKWQYFQENISDYEDKAEELIDSVEDTSELMEEVNECDYGEMLNTSVKSDSINEDYREAIDNLTDANEQVFDQAIDSQLVAIGAYLDSINYGDDTMLEFFKQDYDEVSDTKGIRKLYPIVAALTDGQIAGLEFLSFTDLFQIALSDGNTYKDVSEMTEDIEISSIYENVDRGIYEKGGVALTNKALRAKARESESENEGFKASTLTVAMWGVTVGFAAATVATKVVSSVLCSSELSKIPTQCIKIWNNIDALKTESVNLGKQIVELQQKKVSLFELAYKEENIHIFTDQQKLIDARVGKLTEAQNSGKSLGQSGSSIANKLAIGMAIITVIITVVSTVMTILEAKEYYHTKFVPIPKFMVEEADITTINGKGEKVMIKNQTAYYKAVESNRKAGSDKISKENFEAMGTKNELNGDIGQQWLSLYAVKYLGGAPILADSLLYLKNSEEVPKGYSTGIHEFGATAATNLNNKQYLFVDDAPSIKVFFKIDTKTVTELTSNNNSTTGSLFGVGSGGTAVVSGGMGLIIGTLLGGLIVSRRKKLPVKNS
jgi:hypothetical protein